MKAKLKNLRPQSVLVIAGLLSLVMACQSGFTQKTVPFSAKMNLDSGIEARIDDLLARLDLDRKIGQMTQVERGKLSPRQVRELGIGSVLSGGGSAPEDNSPAGWWNMVNDYQMAALQTDPPIPLLFGTDSVHGNNNLKNATIFPHNIGLGAANDTDLVRRIGQASAKETAAAGIYWTFAPTVAVARDLRWGRTYESFGQNPALVSRLGAAFIQGWQESDLGKAWGIACAKHFLGDGGTLWGSSTMGRYSLDQGDTRGDDTYLQEVLLPPYTAALDQGVKTVMASFSSWNGVKLHGNRELLEGLLKKKLGFNGFVVSDWDGIGQLDPDFHKAVVKAINSGIDMAMLSKDPEGFIATLKKAVLAGEVSQERIDDAVRRILRVKMTMGLFEQPMPPKELAATVRSVEHLALAREAVAKSLVLLENHDRALPLAKTGETLYVAGFAADDLGLQCGGWTLQWQGTQGNNTAGTTILAGLQAALPDRELVYDGFGEFDDVPEGASCLLVLSEVPYAEGVGDTDTLGFDEDNLGVLEAVKERFSKVILVILSGRPMVYDPGEFQAVVAAWLPGTEGDGVADVLCGKVPPTGKLPFDWPVSTDQMPLGRFIDGTEQALYPLGYGLGW